MTVNGLFDVGHTGVADFDCIPVEYFVKHMVLMEFFVYDLEECFADIGSDVFAIGWIVSGSISIMSSFLLASVYIWGC